MCSYPPSANSFTQIQKYKYTNTNFSLITKVCASPLRQFLHPTASISHVLMLWNVIRPLRNHLHLDMIQMLNSIFTPCFNLEKFKTHRYPQPTRPTNCGTTTRGICLGPCVEEPAQMISEIMLAIVEIIEMLAFIL